MALYLLAPHFIANISCRTMLGTICIYFLLISANVYLQALELIWMMYCPEATGLKKYRDSLWMTPQIEGAESMKLTSKFLCLY